MNAKRKQVDEENNKIGDLIEDETEKFEKNALILEKNIIDMQRRIEELDLV